MRRIELEKYLHSNATYLTGRLEGKDIRTTLDLDREDKSNEPVEVIISSKMTGINISFFLGLFSKSLKILKENFTEKYIFVYSDEETRDLIEEDIEYGIKEALDERSIDEILFGKEVK